ARLRNPRRHARNLHRPRPPQARAAARESGLGLLQQRSQPQAPRGRGPPRRRESDRLPEGVHLRSSRRRALGPQVRQAQTLTNLFFLVGNTTCPRKIPTPPSRRGNRCSTAKWHQRSSLSEIYQSLISPPVTEQGAHRPSLRDLCPEGPAARQGAPEPSNEEASDRQSVAVASASPALP